MKEGKTSNESKKEASQNREEHQKGVLLQKETSLLPTRRVTTASLKSAIQALPSPEAHPNLPKCFPLLPGLGLLFSGSMASYTALELPDQLLSGHQYPMSILRPEIMSYSSSPNLYPSFTWHSQYLNICAKLNEVWY